MSEIIEFQQQRINALENELKRLQSTLLEISEVSTRKAIDIKVILNDPNFDKPLTKIF